MPRLYHEAARSCLDASLVREFSVIRRASETLQEGGRPMLASYYGMPQPGAFFLNNPKVGNVRVGSRRIDNQWLPEQSEEGFQCSERS
jgi:hypothetical protein